MQSRESICNITVKSMETVNRNHVVHLNLMIDQEIYCVGRLTTYYLLPILPTLIICGSNEKKQNFTVIFVKIHR
jgi:hypothetical protein